MPADRSPQMLGEEDAVLRRLAALPADSLERRRLRDEVVRTHIGLAKQMALRYRGRGEPLDDLIQVALLGLVRAVDRYQPDLGPSLSAFAVPTILGELRRHFRDHGWSVHVPRPLQELRLRINRYVEEATAAGGTAPSMAEIAAGLQVPLTDVREALLAAQAYRSESLTELDGSSAGSWPADEASYAAVEARESLAALLHRLDDREREIVSLRFYGNCTQREIATRLGLSQMHVSRLLSQVLAWLRSELEADGTEPTRHQPRDRHPILAAPQEIDLTDLGAVPATALLDRPTGHGEVLELPLRVVAG